MGMHLREIDTTDGSPQPASTIGDVLHAGSVVPDQGDRGAVGRAATANGLVGVVLFAAAFGAFAWANTGDLGRSAMQLRLAVPILTAAVGVFFSARAIRFAARAKSALGVPASIMSLLVNYGMMLFGGLEVLVSTFSFTRGRQLRRFGRVLLPGVSPGEAWAKRSQAPRFVASLDDATRAAIADQWRENGRTEHASVAAFARLTLDLMALGAPPELVTAANQDSLDEIRHAEMCFGLARSIDDRAESPAPFAEAARARTLPRSRALALAALAVDSLVDGALHEGVSARIIAKLARRTDDDIVRAILKEIAADEGRHARHGWDVVQWCLLEGGDVVAAALRGAVGRLPRAMRSAIPEAARFGAWEKYGLMGEELEAAEYDAARVELEARTKKLLASNEERRAAA
ncbi:MAG TPA: hypothetical protein VM925_02415 [Labilithrix sp.]|nr:hypothetical protein [Labilithrix sp.]